MIAKLTESQWQLMRDYRTEWQSYLRNGLEGDQQQAEESIAYFYQCVNKPRPVIWWCDSPLQTCLWPILLKNILCLNGDQLGGQLWGQLRGQLGGQLGDQLGGQLRGQLRGQLGDQLWGQLRGQLGDQLRGHWHYGLCDGGWIAFYQFMTKIGVIYSEPCQRLLNAHVQISRNALWMRSFSRISFVSKLPTIIEGQNIEGRWVLHASSGPAIQFRDGYSLWALHGVRVPQALVETPSEQLNVQNWIVQESNAEIRREAVRKIGIERVCQQLKAKTIDSYKNYELLSLDIGKEHPRPYLKMKNPSIGVYHIEGVPQHIDSVCNALKWRNAIQDTEIDEDEGLDWYQQGDVLIKPKHARKLKSHPIILT